MISLHLYPNRYTIKASNAQIIQSKYNVYNKIKNEGEFFENRGNNYKRIYSIQTWIVFNCLEIFSIKII